MKILILGGAGFIGSHVVDMLVAENADITVIGRQLEKYRRPLPQIDYVVGDICNQELVKELLTRGVDSVVHLAWTTIPKTSNDDPIFDVRTNVLDAISLLELCVCYHVRRVVFASSGGAVYGICREASISEECEPFPICSYGITKLAVEKYLAMYNHVHGISGVSLRLANPYGSRQDPTSTQGVVTVFMSRILQGENIEVWGDGSVVRDFIHIHDVVQLFKLSLSGNASGVFNGGSGIGFSINELITAIGAECNVVPSVVYKQGRAIDVPRVVLDSRKACTTFGWMPKISMKEGLRELRSWLVSLKQS